MNNSDQIKEYLIMNKDHINSILQPLGQELINLQSVEHPVFHDLIEQEYLEKARSLITLELTKVLQVNAEECIIVLEDINLKEYLK